MLALMFKYNILKITSRQPIFLMLNCLLTILFIKKPAYSGFFWFYTVDVSQRVIECRISLKSFPSLAVHFRTCCFPVHELREHLASNS